MQEVVKDDSATPLEAGPRPIVATPSPTAPILSPAWTTSNHFEPTAEIALRRRGAIRLGFCLRVAPTAVLTGCAWALAWETLGSFDIGAWLSYAVASAFVLAVALFSGAASRPSTRAALSVGLLAALAIWTAISLGWSPVPSFARDESLLIAFYAVALSVPLVTLRGEGERLAATSLVVVGLGSLALAAAFEVRFAAHPGNLFAGGRLAFPISYPNALAALLLVAFWPAIAVAAELRLPPIVRAAALGGAVAMLSDLLLAQSKGGAISLGVAGFAFFAFCPRRLRALVPALIVLAVVGSQAAVLTEPYRATSTELVSAMRHGGAVTLVLTAVAVAICAVYAIIDRRVTVSEPVRRTAGVIVVAAMTAAAVAGIATFFIAVDRPGHVFTKEWRSFKHISPRDTASTHFFSLGSNRYDFWRVALDEFRSHPVAGMGARGFYNAYLVEGRSNETPQRAHSLELDVLSETGIVGFLLLVGAGGFALASLWPGARVSVAGAGLLAAGVYFAAHTAVDWVWTIPEVGLVAFLLVGIGASSGGGGSLKGRIAIPAGVVALALALFGFAPPWLSSRFVNRAYDAGTISNAGNDLLWARRLDPLSADPDVAQAELSPSPEDIAPLERAVSKEPRREDLRYLLGTAYLRAGRTALARRELREAVRLDPLDDLARMALEKAR